MTALRAKEDKLWGVLVHPHPTQDASERGLNNNMPRWKIPAKARTEHAENMVKNHHFLKGGFAEFYGNNQTNNNNNNNQSGGAGGDTSSPSRVKLAPLHVGGDRKHFAPQHCQEKPWHPSFKKATIDIFPARPTGKRALTPPHQYDRTELEDIPRGKKIIEHDTPQSFQERSELPLFKGTLRSVRDPRTGLRVQDKRCEESAEEVALHRGIRKIGFISNSDREFEDKKMKCDSHRIKNEVEFRREYNARMAASTVGLNRDASSKMARESSMAQENLTRHRASVRRNVVDKSRMNDINIVRNLPSFVRDDD